MVLSIEDLKVDSYATQLSEVELTELKGGATPGLLAYIAVVAAGAVVYTVGSVIVTALNNDSDHKECDNNTIVTVTKLPDGTTVTSTRQQHICRE